MATTARLERCRELVRRAAMNGAWPTLDSLSVFHDRHFDVEVILIEFNGPQAAIFRARDGGRFLGVAADEGSEFVRWLLAEVSQLELAALAADAVPTLEILQKPRLIVLDVRHEDFNCQEVWQVLLSDLDQQNLPEPGARLPREARDLLAEFANQYTTSKPQLVLSKPPSKGSVVSLRAVARSLDVYQRLWTAIGQSTDRSASQRGRWRNDLVARTELGFEFAEAASLKISLVPVDQALYNDIAGKFTQMLSAGSDEEKLNFAFSGMSHRVRNRYREFMSIIEKFDLQVLSQTDGLKGFANSAIASAVLSQLPLAASSDVELVPLSGYFELYGTDGTFTFRDITSDDVVRGTVHDDVRREHASILVGPDGDYDATVKKTVTSFHAQPATLSYELVAVDYGSTSIGNLVTGSDRALSRDV